MHLLQLKVWCPGIPVPQGSMRAFVVRGRPVLTSTSKGLKVWRQQIYSAFAARMQTNVEPIRRGPVTVEMVFHLPKPKSAPKKKVTYPIHRPDLDKLVRACLDALTGAVIMDDSQVIRLNATKIWETNGPGVMVVVTEVAE